MLRGHDGQAAAWHARYAMPLANHLLSKIIQNLLSLNLNGLTCRTCYGD